MQDKVFSIPLQTLMLIALAALVYLLTGASSETLVYQQHAVLQGEWWRWFTSHWVHTGLQHFGLDAIALLILAGTLEYFAPKWVLPSLGLGILMVNLMLWQQNMAVYCGLSGALHAFLLPLIWLLWKRYQSPILPLIAAASLAKMGYETSLQQTLFMTNTWPPIIESHLAGYFGGFILCVVWQVMERNHNPVSYET